MQVVVCETRYPEEAGEEGLHWDVPTIPFLAARNPLYVGVKDQQVSRMKKAIEAEKLGGTSVGFWELITKKGKLNWELIRAHDVVFISSPSRAHESFRDKYTELLESIVSAA